MTAFFFVRSLSRQKKMRPKVQVFSERLLAGDPQLTEELDRAFRVVMVEGLHWAREDLQGQCGVSVLAFPPMEWV